MGLKVQTTSNYSLFRDLLGNRPLDEARVRKLMKSIQKVGQLQEIIVNEKYEVVDGQARLEALKRLSMPVNYIVKAGYGDDQCREMNSTQTGWGASSYIKSYADMGNASYIYLQSLMREFGFSFSVTIAAVTNSAGNRMNHIGLKEGAFEMTGDEYEKAREILNYTKELSPIIKGVKGRLEYYYIAIIAIYKRMPFVNSERFKEQIEKNCAKLKPVDCLDSAMGCLEDAYNYNSRQKVYIQSEYRRYRDAEKTRSRRRK